MNDPSRLIWAALPGDDPDGQDAALREDPPVGTANRSPVEVNAALPLRCGVRAIDFGFQAQVYLAERHADVPGDPAGAPVRPDDVPRLDLALRRGERDGIPVFPYG